MKGQRMAFLGIMAAVLMLCCREENAIPATATAEITETKYVALTFDDGPRASTTGRLLDGLRERGASATFFMIGQQIAGNEDLVRRMRDEGHQVGNHTWDHVKLQGLPEAAVSEEICKTDDAIWDILGDGTYWVRPPYGLLNQNQREWFSTPLVHWSVDPEDWKLLNTQKVVSAVLKKVQPGDIILLHDFYPTSVDAALQIVDKLEAQGYEFVTVEELMALYGVTPQPGEFYTSARKAAE
ncbi:MAG: polysaccharide deacetylase family protein [Oscillibacter ruminantium]|uniref:polysaccharide deacetylase family protein n=1 Tax=Oscillibacter ruminantium TaxID=1263547 RepID=UPI002B2066AB|nr:polysaccharide deacetylase family protein [Oscillibacter ruminantium]MEA5040917.1 polysaccharide deacetylase family protein [Oscillibacter ruminantium]